MDRRDESGESTWAGRVDLEALLVALVLVPHSFPRNRFHELYRWPAAWRVRRRASFLRGLARDLSRRAGAVRVRGETLGPDGLITIVYEVPALGLRRTTRLRPAELDLVRLLVARARRGAPRGADSGELEVGDLDVDAAQGQLAQVLARLYHAG